VLRDKEVVGVFVRFRAPHMAHLASIRASSGPPSR
jgi:hypothetical protein